MPLPIGQHRPNHGCGGLDGLAGMSTQELEGTGPRPASLFPLPSSFSFSLNQPAEQQTISLGLGREARPGLRGARACLCLDPLFLLFIDMATSWGGRSMTCQGVPGQLGFLRPRWVSWVGVSRGPGGPHPQLFSFLQPIGSALCSETLEAAWNEDGFTHEVKHHHSLTRSPTRPWPRLGNGHIRGQTRSPN